MLLGLNKIHLKTDCVKESFSNGIRKPVSFSFSEDKPLTNRRLKTPNLNVIKNKQISDKADDSLPRGR